MLACARVVAVSGVPPGGMCARGWEDSRVTQGLAKQLGQWQGQFPPWGGHRRRSLVGSGVGGGKNYLWAWVVWDAYLKFKGETKEFPCVTEHELFNLSTIDGYLGGLQFLQAQTMLPSVGLVGVFLRDKFQVVEALVQRVWMFFKYILPNGPSKRFHQFIFPPKVHENVKFSTLLPTMGIINLLKKPLPIWEAKNISLF